MTRLPEMLDDAVGPVGVGFDIDDLDRRVARRVVERGACAPAVACSPSWCWPRCSWRRRSAAGVLALPTCGSNRRRRCPWSRLRAGDVLLFDDTGGVLAVDMTTHIATRVPIKGWRPGDQPFQSLRVGNSLVVGWGDVHASSLDGKVSHLLGTGVFVAATEPGAVWLTSYGQVETSTERLVDLQGHVLREGPAPAPYALTGIPGGLAFQTNTGIDIWDARSGRITRHLGTSTGFAAPAFGSLLAWCDHCTNQLELTDVSTGTTRSVPVDVGGATLALNRVIFSRTGRGSRSRRPPTRRLRPARGPRSSSSTCRARGWWISWR